MYDVCIECIACACVLLSLELYDFYITAVLFEKKFGVFRLVVTFGNMGRTHHKKSKKSSGVPQPIFMMPQMMPQMMNPAMMQQVPQPTQESSESSADEGETSKPAPKPDAEIPRNVTMVRAIARKNMLEILEHIHPTLDRAWMAELGQTGLMALLWCISKTKPNCKISDLGSVFIKI